MILITKLRFGELKYCPVTSYRKRVRTLPIRHELLNILFTVQEVHDDSQNFPMLHVLSDSLFADRFNRIDRLFSQLTGSTPLPSTPSYNIRLLGDNRYELTLSVPGWKKSELEIETVGGQLNISGKREEEKTENGEEGWIHRGISRQRLPGQL